jgi:3-methyladenine DNA glycosylase AlkD
MTGIVAELKRLGKKDKATVLSRFFKTGPGEYGAGDIFLGATVPELRVLARKYSHLGLAELQKLLASPIHEFRLTALLILVIKFEKALGLERKKLVDFYLKNTNNINNWDLVDLSVYKILGCYLLDKPRAVLYRLARSKNLWERRIAIIATFAFIRQNDFSDTMKIAQKLLLDKHDLIQKAVGWMLREVGKRDLAQEEAFLRQHYRVMPRTMLRYAIEKFPEPKRKKYLTK